MVKKSRAVFIAFPVFLLLVMGSGSFFISTLQAEEGTPQKYLSHERKVFVSRLPLSSCGNCEVIAPVSTAPSPHASAPYRDLADKGRALGADAVFDAKRKIDVSHGAKSFIGFGVAVKIRDPAAVDFSQESGRWF
ncbi:MAG TPA: hypothetical protein PKL99_08290 [Syntrophales bacterium]|nr:hypothetical protein [Syntrophales bacterium]